MAGRRCRLSRPRMHFESPAAHRPACLTQAANSPAAWLRPVPGNPRRRRRRRVPADALCASAGRAAPRCAARCPLPSSCHQEPLGRRPSAAALPRLALACRRQPGLQSWLPARGAQSCCPAGSRRPRSAGARAGCGRRCTRGRPRGRGRGRLRAGGRPRCPCWCMLLLLLRLPRCPRWRCRCPAACCWPTAAAAAAVAPRLGDRAAAGQAAEAACWGGWPSGRAPGRLHLRPDTTRRRSDLPLLPAPPRRCPMASCHRHPRKAAGGTALRAARPGCKRWPPTGPHGRPPHPAGLPPQPSAPTPTAAPPAPRHHRVTGREWRLQRRMPSPADPAGGAAAWSAGFCRWRPPSIPRGAYGQGQAEVGVLTCTGRQARKA